MLLMPSTNVLANNDNLSGEQKNNVVYKVTDNAIIETSIFNINSKEMKIVKEIYKDNSAIIEVTYDDYYKKSTTSIDYNIYKNFVLRNNFNKYTINNIKSLSNYGCPDLSGSQYYNVPIGDGVYDTIYSSRYLGEAAYIVGNLTSHFSETIGYMPGQALGMLAAEIGERMLADPAYKYVVNSHAYEVMFSYDNTYYIHCYHNTISEYNIYSKFIRSYKECYQAIGG